MRIIYSLALALVLTSCVNSPTNHACQISHRQQSTEIAVEVRGEVARPGVYLMRPGATVRDLVRVAGGLNDFATGIRWLRGGPTSVDHYYGNMRRTRSSSIMRTVLQSGDIVYIDRTI